MPLECARSAIKKGTKTKQWAHQKESNEKGCRTYSRCEALPIVAVDDDLIATGRQIHQHAQRYCQAGGLGSNKKQTDD